MIFTPLLRALAGIAAAISAGLGCFTLAAWAIDRWHLATLGQDYVPMAPITAVTCVLLAVSLASRLVWPKARSTRFVAAACAFFPLAVGTLVAVQTWRFFPLPWDTWMLPADASSQAIPIGRMAPLTAAALLCTAVAAWRGHGRVAALAGGTGLTIGVMATLGYVTGTPLHYDGSVVPMALLTALAFTALNAGFLLIGPVDECLLAWDAEIAALKFPSEPHAFTRRLVISATAVGALIVCLSFFYLRSEQADARRDASEELNAIARLKVDQIATWRAERLAEAHFLLRTPDVVRDAAAFIRRPEDPDTRTQLLGWLNAIKGGARYASVFVFDAQSRLRLAIPDAAGSAPRVAGSLLAGALASAEPVFTDFGPNADGATPHLDLLVPIRQDGPATTAVAVIVLRLDPRQFLFPLIGDWPVPSATAESLLVRREAHEIVQLNPFRHRPDPLSAGRPSREDRTVLASRVARGELGVLECSDYRDVPVLASIQPVPGSPWILIAKIDQAEIYASIRHTAWHTATLIFVLLAAVALAGAAMWRQKRATLLHRALAAERERNAVAQRLALIMQHANDVILLLDDEGRILEANERALATYGYTLEEFRALPRGGLRPAPVSEEFAGQYNLLESPDGVVFETLHRRKDGSVFPVEISGRGVLIDGRRHVLGIYRDITERKKAEAELQFRNVLLSTQQETSLDGILVVDAAARILSYNRRFVEMWAIPPTLLQTEADEPLLQFVTAQIADPAAFLARVAHLYEHRQATSRDELLLADGRIFDRYSAPIFGPDERYYGRVWYFRDITERKNHEREIERLNRVYFVISQVNQALVRAKTREILFAEVCRVLVEIGGFRLAWIGWLNPTTQLIAPVAVAGDRHDYVSALRISTDANAPEGRGPSGVAFRDGCTYVCNDFFADPATVIWRERAQAVGFQSSIALPLRCEGQTRGLLTVYAAEKNFYAPREITLLEEAAGDVSFALDVFANEVRRGEAEVALRQSEERFRSIFEEAPLGVALIDSLTGRIIEVNAQYAAIAGRTKSALAAIDWMSLTHPDDVAADLDQMARMNAGQISGYHLDKRYLRPDGSPVWIHMTIAPIAVEDRSHPRHLAMIQDITEAKRAEAALRQSTEDLRARNEALTRFNHVAVGRELRMIELKREVNDLCEKLGEPPRHRIAGREPVAQATTPPTT